MVWHLFSPLRLSGRRNKSLTNLYKDIKIDGLSLLFIK